MTRELVEKVIQERFEQYESGKLVGDAKNRAISLKLRSSQVGNPSQENQSNKRYQGTTNEDLFESQPNMLRDEIDSMKMEMVRELRDMKQSMKENSQTYLELIREVKETNRILAQSLKGVEATQPRKNLLDQLPESNKALSVEVQDSLEERISSGLVPQSQQEEEKEVQKPQVVGPTLRMDELSEEQVAKLDKSVEELIAKFSSGEDKKTGINILKLPFSTILKNPEAENKRTMQMTNGMIQKFLKMNTHLPKFLEEIGYVKHNDSTFKFLE